MEAPPHIEAREIILDRLKFVSQTQIARELLYDAEVRQVWDHFADRLIVTLSAEVLADKLVEKEQRVVFSFPASPWQHVKAGVFPRLGPVGRWLLRMAPVVHSARAFHVSFREYATFPENTRRYPKELGSPRWLQMVVAHSEEEVS